MYLLLEKDVSRPVLYWRVKPLYFRQTLFIFFQLIKLPDPECISLKNTNVDTSQKSNKSREFTRRLSFLHYIVSRKDDDLLLKQVL